MSAATHRGARKDINVSEHFSTELPAAVLDTQAVLDWLYFRDPSCVPWGAPGQDWRWLASGPMRDELAHVLARGFGEKWPSSWEHVLAFFDAHACLQAASAPGADLVRALRCSDPDDQKFIDLALATGARWLVSRDRAVLKLRRRAWALAGLRIVRPDEWQPGQA